jgi:hypothetical protein
VLGTSAGTFTCGFAPPSLVNVRCSATSRGNPAPSASSSTGTNPAHDTRLGSSNTAVTPCETRIYRMPLPLTWNRSLDKIDSLAAEGHLGLTTRGSPHAGRWIRA